MSNTRRFFAPEYRDHFVTWTALEHPELRVGCRCGWVGFWIWRASGFTDIDEAYTLVETALSAVRHLRDGAFWKLAADQQLDLGRRVEVLARTVYAAQLHQAG